MSALNVFVTPDAVHMFTDGGQYDSQTMALAGIAPKVALFPQHNAAMGCTGHSFIPRLMQISMNDAKFTSYDDLITKFETFLPKTIAHWGTLPNGPKDWGAFSIVIAGWSDREDGPTAHQIQGWGDTETAAFSLRELTRFRAPQNAEVNAVPFDPANPDQSGLAIMREQRLHKFGSPTADTNRRDAIRNMMARPEDRTDAFHVVHGFCQRTRVDRDGIHTKILERWD